jgi:hypothetical protein
MLNLGTITSGVVLALHFESRLPAPGKEVQHYHDERDHQQEVDEPAHRVTGYETEKPHNDQDYRNCE